jgi:hypothetical protein
MEKELTTTTTGLCEYKSMYESILDVTLNRCPTEYKSFQIKYYRDIYKKSQMLAEQFIERKIKFKHNRNNSIDVDNDEDKTIYEFFIRTMVIMLINREISNKPINVLLSNLGGTHNSIIVNTVEFREGYNLVKNQKRDKFLYKTLLGPLKFNVGYFENRKLNSQIIFKHQLAQKFAKNNTTLKGILMMRTHEETPLIIECKEYLESIEEVLVDDNEEIYLENAKEVSAKIQAQYMMLQIIASVIIAHYKMI